MEQDGFSLESPPVSREEERRDRYRERYANDPKYKAKRLAWYNKRCANDPEYKAKQAAKKKERRANDPEYKAKESAQYKERYADPEYRAKLLAKKKERRANDPEYRAKESARKKRPEYRARKIAATYGLTLDQYYELLASTRGRCPICRIPFSNKIRGMCPCVDHCHRTGKVRGILCHNCNRSLSELLDQPKLLRAAARYLERTAADVPLQENPGQSAADRGRVEQAG